MGDRDLKPQNVIRWRRHMAGSYDSRCGRFSIHHDGTFASVMWGAPATPWVLSGHRDRTMRFPTLTRAKRRCQVFVLGVGAGSSSSKITERSA